MRIEIQRNIHLQKNLRRSSQLKNFDLRECMSEYESVLFSE